VAKLLELLVARSNSEPGKRIQVEFDKDWPLVDAGSDNQLAYLVKHLEETGYLVFHGGPFYTLTPTAWERLEAAGIGQGIPGKCFVAMSFHESLKQAYEVGIYLAVKDDCKMNPVRIDLVEHNEKICDKIVAEIRTCQFLVADVTLQRAGVYFEAGFAMGLGRPVIWSCREDDLSNVHFDTRQYNHIVWREPEDLREKLADRIKATITGA
jgi:nucleoside 2-deoxyribosyltransferase